MRVTNRVLSFVFGTVLAGAAGLAAAEMVAGFFNAGPLLVPVDDWGARAQAAAWGDVAVIVTCVGMVLVGLLILAAVITPRRPVQLAMRDHDDHKASIDRRGLEHRLRSVALRDGDVVAAKVHIRRRVKVHAQVPPDTDERQVRQRLRQSVRTAVDELDLQRRLGSKVKVGEAKERVR